MDFTDNRWLRLQWNYIFQTYYTILCSVYQLIPATEEVFMRTPRLFMKDIEGLNDRYYHHCLRRRNYQERLFTRGYFTREDRGVNYHIKYFPARSDIRQVIVTNTQLNNPVNRRHYTNTRFYLEFYKIACEYYHLEYVSQTIFLIEPTMYIIEVGDLHLAYLEYTRNTPIINRMNREVFVRYMSDTHVIYHNIIPHQLVFTSMIDDENDEVLITFGDLQFHHHQELLHQQQPDELEDAQNFLVQQLDQIEAEGNPQDGQEDEELNQVLNESLRLFAPIITPAEHIQNLRRLCIRLCPLCTMPVGTNDFFICDRCLYFFIMRTICPRYTRNWIVFPPLPTPVDEDAETESEGEVEFVVDAVVDPESETENETD